MLLVVCRRIVSGSSALACVASNSFTVSLFLVICRLVASEFLVVASDKVAVVLPLIVVCHGVAVAKICRCDASDSVAVALLLLVICRRVATSSFVVSFLLVKGWLVASVFLVVASMLIQLL